MESPNEVNSTVPILAILKAETNTEAGMDVVLFRRKKVSEADSYRAVMVPQYVGLNCIAFGDGTQEEMETEVTAILESALREVFMDAAGSILRSYCDENPKAESIPAALLDFSAVVVAMQALQTSQRLNGDAIAAWYDASKTKTDATARYESKPNGKDLEKGLRDKYLSLASNNPAIKPNLAEKMMAYINADDASTAVCKAVIKRLERLSKTDTTSDEL